MVYYCVLESDEKFGGYTVTFPDVPGVVTEGETQDEALFNAAEALNGVLEATISRGLPVPETRNSMPKEWFPIKVAKAFGKRLEVSLV